jgi:hypothetical protein
MPTWDVKLDFGPWEQDFDGKRPKRVLVKVIGVGCRGVTSQP